MPPFDTVSPTTELLATWFCERMQERLPAAEIRSATVWRDRTAARPTSPADARLILASPPSFSPLPRARRLSRSRASRWPSSQWRPPRSGLQLGSFAELSLRITPLADLAPGVVPQVFLHLVDEPGSVLRTFDHTLPGEFRHGREIAYRVRIHQSAIAEPLAAGRLHADGGLYDGAGGRFRLRSASPEVARLEYAVGHRARARAVAGDARRALLPELAAGRAGQDRQIVARRPLAGAGPGTLQIGPLQGPGEILLRVGLPAAGSGRLESLAADTTPKIRLHSSCGDFSAELSGEAGADGSGVELLIPVPATAGPAECDLRIEPNFWCAAATRPRRGRSASRCSPGGPARRTKRNAPDE